MSKSIDIRKTRKNVVNLKKLKKASSSSKTNRPVGQTLSRRGIKGTTKKSLPDYFNEGKASYQKIRRYPKKKKFSFLTFLIVLLFLLVTAAIAGFFVFYDKGPVGKSLKLALAAPKEVTAGRDFTLALYYENLDKVKLGQIEVVIEYPENFYFQEANQEPINEEKNVWRLIPLQPGENDRIQVTGYLIGEVKEEEEFRVFFRYQPENFSSDFQESISKKITIKDSLLKVTVEAPEMIEDGAEVEFKVKCKNDLEETLENLVISFDLGEAFSVSEINLNSTGTAWQIKQLKGGGGEEELVLKGTIDSTLVNPLEWYFVAGMFDEEELVRYLYKTDGKIKIEAPKVLINLSLVDEEQELSWGGDANYQIEIENNGEIAINQAVLKLTFLTDFIDWGSFNNQSNAALDSKTNSLVWLSTNGGWTEQLEEIKQGDKIELLVAIPLQNVSEVLLDYSPDELVIDAVAMISFKSQDQHKLFSSEHLIQNITSETKLITEAKYYLDQQTAVGSGPIPPVIGQTTIYRIYWKLYSGSQGLSDVKIKTTLPAYIVWQEDSSEVTMGSPLEFDSATKEVIWEIDNISVNSQVMASFDVAVTPTESQVNQLLILTNPASLEAKEQQSGSLVSQTTNLLTSDLIDDPVAQGQGRVTVGQ